MIPVILQLFVDKVYRLSIELSEILLVVATELPLIPISELVALPVLFKYKPFMVLLLIVSLVVLPVYRMPLMLEADKDASFEIPLL